MTTSLKGDAQAVAGRLGHGFFPCPCGQELAGPVRQADARPGRRAHRPRAPCARATACPRHRRAGVRGRRAVPRRRRPGFSRWRRRRDLRSASPNGKARYPSSLVYRAARRTGSRSGRSARRPGAGRHTPRGRSSRARSRRRTGRGPHPAGRRPSADVRYRRRAWPGGRDASCRRAHQTWAIPACGAGTIRPATAAELTSGVRARAGVDMTGRGRHDPAGRRRPGRRVG